MNSLFDSSGINFGMIFPFLLIFSLVSAFEDKFMHFNKYYTKALAKPIKAKYGEMSFRTFVQHILDNKGCRTRTKCSLDVHWMPFYINCGYCSLKYKYFVRAEHFNTDTKFIGLLMNKTFLEIGENNFSFDIKLRLSPDNHILIYSFNFMTLLIFV